MKHTRRARLFSLLQAGFLCLLVHGLSAQTLINVDFGAGRQSRKIGMAAFGQTTNDFWNLYRHYDPRYAPGSPLVYSGELARLKMADVSETAVSLAVSNAPGVWGNMTGDPMYDTYVFARHGSNLVARLNGLPAGRYHFYLYGHAEADVTGEQNSVFELQSGTNRFGPLATTPSPAWKSGDPWREGFQYLVFRDVPVSENEPIIITVEPGPGGVAVWNGLQISSRGTSPPAWSRPPAAAREAGWTNLLIHAVTYEGTVDQHNAQFSVTLDIESKTTNPISTLLFQGEVALQAGDLPPAARLAASHGQFRIFTQGLGRHRLQFDLASKVRREAPWNQTAFTGPSAAIATIKVTAADPRLELELREGIQDPGGVEALAASSAPSAGGAALHGLIGSDGVVSLRWRNRQETVARQVWIGVDTASTAQISPATIRYRTQFDYSFLQGGVSNLSLLVPADQTVTRLEGDQIRDWGLVEKAGRQELRIDLLRGQNQAYRLVVHSEQPLEASESTATLQAPEPQGVSRETGALSISAEDMQVEVRSTAGLRRVNAPAGILAAYRFSSRPLALTAGLRPVQPALRAAHRLRARLEESRWLLQDRLEVTVEKAGIYSLEARLPDGFSVTDVQGEGISDWSATNASLRITFANRLIGSRPLDVHLEQAFRTLPDQVEVRALRLDRFQRETARLGVSSAPGLQLKTRELSGLREVPVNALPDSGEAVLAYESAQSEWRLALATERLSPRVVAEVFNLITIGEGMVGGSAILRLGIVNQGLQELRLRLSDHWRNLDFTGPNIRRKEKQGQDWVIGLQDKAWNGYTLVITYDFPFDAAGAVILLGGAHAVGVERETGSLAIASAGGLQLEPQAVSPALRRIDESEIGAADRAMITRPVLLAWRYEGPSFDLQIQARRYEPLQVLEAVADRTQLTTVVNPEGQTLTQASFRVKNNEKQFQRFRLPAGAEFWSCFVNGQPVKAEKDGDWILAPLPRQANRDQAFAVELVYAQKLDPLNHWRSSRLNLVSPGTDVPNTYAEWEVFLPSTHRLAHMSGNMTVAQGAAYDWREAWKRFVTFYVRQWHDHGAWAAALGILAILMLALAWGWMRRGLRGAWTVVILFALLMVLAGMLLPALSKAKAKAGRLQASYQREEEAKWAEVRARGGGEEGQALPTVSASSAEPAAGVPIKREDIPGLVTLNQPGSAPPPPPALSQNEASQTGRSFGVAQTPAGGFGGGGFGGELGDRLAAASQPARPDIAPPATVRDSLARSTVIAEGIRPIHIDIPQSGQLITFTKTLNTDGQPLTVQARVVKQSVEVLIRSILQAGVFLAGLLLIWRSRMAPQASSAWTGLGGLMVLAAIGHWLMSWQWLHLAFILVVPLLALALLGILIATLWPSRPRPASSATAALLLGFWALAGGSEVRSGELMPDPLFPNTVSILSATYQGTVSEQAARITSTLRLAAARTNQFVPLFQRETAVSGFRLVSGHATLLRQGSWVGLHLPEGGAAAMEIDLALRPQGDTARRRLAFAIPPALSSQFDLRLPGAETEVEFPAAVVLKKTAQNGQTRIEALLGPVSQVELSWAPRTKQAAETAATVFCQNSSLLHFAPNMLQTHCQLDYQITQGELRVLRIDLPAHHRLLRIHGEGIETWSQTETNGQATMAVELVKAVTGQYRLTLETERDLNLPATVSLQVPSAVDVRRESGFLAIQAEDEIGITAQTNTIARAEAGDFEQASGLKLEGAASVFRFLRPDFKLAVLAATLQPEVEAQARHHYRVGFEQIRLAAQVDYQIKRAGLFHLRLGLPSGYRVETVTGDKVLSWMERLETNRVLEVTLKERTLGAGSIHLNLARSLDDLPAAITFDGIQPLAALKTSATVAVTSETGIALKASAFEGLVEIPAAELLSAQRGAPTPASRPMASQNALAFKTLSSTATAAAEWKLTIATETVEAWVRSEIAHSFQIEETLLTGRAVIRYEIANAPVKRFRLRAPPQMAHLEFTGDNIRRRDQQGQEWLIELQNKVSGFYYLAVQWDQPLSSLTNRLDLSGVQILEVERETGYLAILTRPPFQALEQGSSNLVKIDPADLPDWSGLGQPPASPTGQALSVVRAYRYLKPGYDLRLEVKRYEEAGVLQALVDQAHLTTVQAEDGQWMTRVILEIRNNGRQHLELRLPPPSELWSAFVASQPVQPVRRAESILLPLERSGSDGAPVRVELMVTGRRSFPLRRGTVEWASPRLDLPIKKARWDLYLPLDYRYHDFTGSMRLTEAGRSEDQTIQKYTERDYSEQESKAKVSQQSEVYLDLSNIRQNLAKGNYREAAERFSQARQKEVFFNTANPDLEQVEKELRRVQGSNLIQAQNAFSFQSLNGQAALSQVRLEMGNADLRQQSYGQYDAVVAEQQWAKLQQAQEVVSARKQPLRVNLPIRGLHYTFTQILQTDQDKPMTISLKAVSLQRRGWTSPLALGGGIFLVSWMWAARARARHPANRY